MLRAIFRSALFAVTADDAHYLDTSNQIAFQSAGFKTPNAVWYPSTTLQRIDATVDVVASPTIAAAGTFTLPIAALVAANRTLIRIQAQCNFSVSVTPNAGTAQVIQCVGSQYQPGIYEVTLASCSACAVTNTSAAAAVFTVAAANVLDYNDGSIPAVTQ